MMGLVWEFSSKLDTINSYCFEELRRLGGLPAYADSSFHLERYRYVFATKINQSVWEQTY